MRVRRAGTSFYRRWVEYHPMNRRAQRFYHPVRDYISSGSDPAEIWVFHRHNILDAPKGFGRDSNGKTSSRFPLNGPENADRNGIKTISFRSTLPAAGTMGVHRRPDWHISSEHTPYHSLSRRWKSSLISPLLLSNRDPLTLGSRLA